MFDWYEPVPAIECPRCGTPVIAEWQGKQGPMALLVWRQGRAAPIAQRVDEEVRWSDEELMRFRLPSVFELHSECSAGHWVEANGACDESGTWTNMLEVRAFNSLQDFNEWERRRR